MLHCYKLWVAKKCGENEIPKAITITQDKLLDIMWDTKDEKNIFTKQAEQCRDFIIDMLYYRVLFDYFVIKNNVDLSQGNTFRIRRLQEYKNNGKTYYRLPEDTTADNSPLNKLATLQNYLRVARQGEKQNYHHWLTPFLKFLRDKNDLGVNLDFLKNDKIDTNQFKDKADKIAKKFIIGANEKLQDNLVAFLENLDRKLAVGQLRKIKKNNLLDITNKIISNIDEHLNFKIEQKMVEKISNLYKSKQYLFFQKECFLNMGTNTPHYWFYRLEYYLWKLGKYATEKFTSFKETESKIYNTELGEGKDKIAFKDIFAKNLFYFRLLGSIEHFSAVNRQPQRTDNSWDIDIFGNLALISSNLNSSLSNQIEKHKKDEIINQLKRNRIESLKYFIMCANLKSDEWMGKDTKSHQNQMLEILIHSLNGNKAQ